MIQKAKQADQNEFRFRKPGSISERKATIHHPLGFGKSFRYLRGRGVSRPLTPTARSYSFQGCVGYLKFNVTLTRLEQNSTKALRVTPRVQLKKLPEGSDI